MEDRVAPNNGSAETHFSSEDIAAIARHLSGGILVTGPDGSIQWANAGFLKLTGYSLEEVMGKKPGDLLQGPGTNPSTVEAIRQHLRRHESFEVEILNYSKSGEPYTLYLKVDPVFDEEGNLEHFVGFQTDISARRKQAELMQSILHSAHYGIVTLNLEGRIVSFNQGSEQLLGYSESEALSGLDPLTFHDPKQLRERATYLSSKLGRPVETNLQVFQVIASQNLSSEFDEWIYVRKDGKKIFVDLALTELKDLEGRVGGYLGILKDRTELHFAESRLRDFAGRLTKLSRLIPGVIYQYELLPDGRSRFPYASSAIEAIYRVTPGQVKEDASAVFAVLHPEDRDRVSNAIQESARNLESWEQEYRTLFPDGTVRWLYGNANPERLENGGTLWHGFITDITERKDNERRLRDSEERLTMALEATQDGVWDWDLKTNRVFWSPRCYTMLGYQPDSFEVTYEKWQELLHPADREKTLNGVRKTMEDPDSQLDLLFRLRHNDGTFRWISGRGKVTDMDKKGNPVRMVGTHLDITDRKLQDEALRTANRRLEDTNRQLELSIWHANELARQAEAANEAKSAFIANMSHEIRTPMTSILGYADLLSESQKSGDNIDEYLQRLHEAGQHLMTIVNDILDISRIESGKLETEALPVSPVQIIDEVTNMLRGKATIRGLQLKRVLRPETPEYIQTDPGRLRQILLNLVGNAVKFTETGSVTIESGKSDSQVYISVSDTGIGIPRGAIHDLFQPFMQGDSSTTRKYGGSGLGLAISQRLAQLMGGQILAESEEGKGSKFTLQLPLSLPELASREQPPDHAYVTEASDPQTMDMGRGYPHAKAAPPDVKVPSLDGMKVLVVEDDPDIRNIVSLYLSRSKVKVHTLENGKEALRHLLEDETDYDCVLMDIQMPEMDGKTVMIQLKEMNFACPVVAMTAHALSAEVATILKAGFDGYLAKPIDRKTLHEALQKYKVSY